MSKSEEAYRAQFILNALDDGWTVKQSNTRTGSSYKFTKSTKCFDGPTLESVKHEQFTRKFIRKYVPEKEKAKDKESDKTVNKE